MFERVDFQLLGIGSFLFLMTFILAFVFNFLILFLPLFLVTGSLAFMTIASFALIFVSIFPGKKPKIYEK